MLNTTRPTPPNLSEGCFICGEGKDQILTSKLVQGGSVALCSKHQNATTLPPKGAKV